MEKKNNKYKIEEYITPWKKRKWHVWKLVLDGYFWHLVRTFETLEEAKNYVKKWGDIV